jgi:hypothetical protein
MIAQNSTALSGQVPQPSRNARVMTLRFVPGGPDPMTNGFGNLSPSTVVASVGMRPPLRGESLCLPLSREKLDRILQTKLLGGSRAPPRDVSSPRLQLVARYMSLITFLSQVILYRGACFDIVWRRRRHQPRLSSLSLVRFRRKGAVS